MQPQGDKSKKGGLKTREQSKQQRRTQVVNTIIGNKYYIINSLLKNTLKLIT